MRGLEDKMKEDIINKCNKIVKINVSTVKEPQIRIKGRKEKKMRK